MARQGSRASISRGMFDLQSSRSVLELWPQPRPHPYYSILISLRNLSFIRSLCPSAKPRLFPESSGRHQPVHIWRIFNREPGSIAPNGQSREGPAWCWTEESESLYVSSSILHKSNHQSSVHDSCYLPDWLRPLLISPPLPTRNRFKPTTPLAILAATETIAIDPIWDSLSCLGTRESTHADIRLLFRIHREPRDPHVFHGLPAFSLLVWPY